MDDNARQQFCRRVDEAGGAVKMAAILGVTRAWVYRIMDGALPGRELELVIEDRLNIQRSGWDALRRDRRKKRDRSGRAA